MLKLHKLCRLKYIDVYKRQVIIFVTDAKGNVLLSGNEQEVSLSEQIAPELLPSLSDDGSAGDSGGAAGDEAGNAGSSADSSTGGSAATAANVAPVSYTHLAAGA